MFKRYAAQMLILLFFSHCSPQGDDKSSKDPETISSNGALVSETDTFFIGTTLVKVEKINKAEFGEETFPKLDSSGAYALNSGGLVHKHGDSLIIKCKQGTAVLVNDHSDNDQSAEYTYIGYYPAIGQHVVHGAFWEWTNYLLIDAETADTTVVYDIPQVSPDGDQFVSGDVDLVADMGFNGIALYKNASKTTLIGARTLSKWGPHNIKWADNKTLLIEAAYLDTIDNKEKTVFYKLHLE